jgi:hypothetical protein
MFEWHALALLAWNAGNCSFVFLCWPASCLREQGIAVMSRALQLAVH